jgi:hypothetical protein
MGNKISFPFVVIHCKRDVRGCRSFFGVIFGSPDFINPELNARSMCDLWIFLGYFRECGIFFGIGPKYPAYFRGSRKYSRTPEKEVVYDPGEFPGVRQYIPDSRKNSLNPLLPHIMTPAGTSLFEFKKLFYLNGLSVQKSGWRSEKYGFKRLRMNGLYWY